MKSLKDKVNRFLKKINNQDDIRDITQAAKELAKLAHDLLHEHEQNGELVPLLKIIYSSAAETAKVYSRKFIMSIWVQDIRESMKAIEELVHEEKKELV